MFHVLKRSRRENSVTFSLADIRVRRFMKLYKCLQNFVNLLTWLSAREIFIEVRYVHPTSKFLQEFVGRNILHFILC